MISFKYVLINDNSLVDTALPRDARWNFKLSELHVTLLLLQLQLLLTAKIEFPNILKSEPVKR